MEYGLKTTVNANTQETTVLLPVENSKWQHAAAQIVCTMAGTGILALPHGLYQGGWWSLILLLTTCAASIYAGIRLGDVMIAATNSGARVNSYSDVGQFVMGTTGRYLSKFAYFTTLCGVSIIFLILLGINVTNLFNWDMNKWKPVVILVSACVLSPCAIIMKSIGETRFVSLAGFACTLITSVFIWILAAAHIGGSNYDPGHANKHRLIASDGLGIAFSLFTFSFGGASLYPNLFTSLGNKQDWNKAVIAALLACLGMYLPTTILGYWAYGAELENNKKGNTILAAISGSKGFDFHNAVWWGNNIATAIITVHIAMAWPLVVNPVFTSIERWQKISIGPLTPVRIMWRGLICLICLVMALFFPFFLDMVTIVTDISVTLAVYVLPCAFYIRACSPGPVHTVICVIVILYSFTGSGFGLYYGMKDLINDVKANPNPFANW